MTKQVMMMCALMALGCGGGASEASSGEPTGGSDAVETPAADIAWADMNHEQRAEYMHDVVVPAMDPLFRPYHPDFGCKTCHGENAREVDFHMPNGIAPLDPQAMPFASEDEQTRQTAQFMAEQVETRMADLLGEEPYDMETHQGFGCFGCHGMASSEAPAAAE